MLLLLSLLPVLLTIGGLQLGVRSAYAALLGVFAAGVAVAVGFPVALTEVPVIVGRWLPILIEVLLIVGGGLLLSETLRAAGAQSELARWISGRSNQGVAAVLLVVHGVTPFAESLTGFGIGITIGIPLLAHFGLPARKVALIGLLGLCSVPWGSMGPGTLIAAKMADLSFYELGIASAALSVIPFTVTGVAAAWLASTPGARIPAVLQGTLSGLLLTVLVAGFNFAFGTAPAGALAGMTMVVLHLLRSDGAVKASLGPQGRNALVTYAVLLGGVLLGGWVVRLANLSEAERFLGSPALWLYIAVVWFNRGLPTSTTRRIVWRSWAQVAPVTGLFIGMGVLMAASGMAAYLAHALAMSGDLYLIVAPFVGALGGFVTGSNTGANAMFATTQSEIARALDVDLLWFIAVHNVAASFLLMASPSKVELALQLSPPEAASHRRWLQSTVLRIALVVVAVLAACNLLIGT